MVLFIIAFSCLKFQDEFCQKLRKIVEHVKIMPKNTFHFFPNLGVLSYLQILKIRAFNAVFSKVERVALENVVVELLETKCLTILLYGLETCPLSKTQRKSLNYAVSSSFIKNYNVSSDEIVYSCRCMFNCADIENIPSIIKKDW